MGGPILPTTRDKTRNGSETTSVTLVLRQPGIKGEILYIFRTIVPDKDNGITGYITGVVDSVVTPDNRSKPTPTVLKRFASTTILAIGRIPVLLPVQTSLPQTRPSSYSSRLTPSQLRVLVCFPIGSSIRPGAIKTDDAPVPDLHTSSKETSGSF